MSAWTVRSGGARAIVRLEAWRGRGTEIAIPFGIPPDGMTRVDARNTMAQVPYEQRQFARSRCLPNVRWGMQAMATIVSWL